MRVQTVHPAEVRRWWGFARPLVQDVLRICREPQIPEDIYVSLKTDRALLHVLFIDEQPKGCAVTEICGEPDNRFLNVWILHFVQNVDENRQDILRWLDGLAKAQGCPSIRFQSPRAWSKLLRNDFREKSVTYEREVK